VEVEKAETEKSDAEAQAETKEVSTEARLDETKTKSEEVEKKPAEGEAKADEAETKADEAETKADEAKIKASEVSPASEDAEKAREGRKIIDLAADEEDAELDELVTKDVSVCRESIKRTRCREENPFWYFNTHSKSCQKYQFGGCGRDTTGNWFRTEAACAALCTSGIA